MIFLITLPDQVKTYARKTAEHTEKFFKHLEGKINAIKSKSTITAADKQLIEERNHYNWRFNKIAVHLENMGVRGALGVVDKFRGGTKNNLHKLIDTMEQADFGHGVFPQGRIVYMESELYLKGS